MGALSMKSKLLSLMTSSAASQSPLSSRNISTSSNPTSARVALMVLSSPISLWKEKDIPCSFAASISTYPATKDVWGCPCTASRPPGRSRSLHFSNTSGMSLNQGSACPHMIALKLSPFSPMAEGFSQSPRRKVTTHRMASPAARSLAFATSSIPSEMSTPSTWPESPTKVAAWNAVMPVPVPTSSTTCPLLSPAARTSSSEVLVCHRPLSPWSYLAARFPYISPTSRAYFSRVGGDSCETWM
mmetsp:Transcript_8669/g.28495  ORF Transcript_8669/g.28495 Transcript_8669/m.28495 type:complete len:243 (+) Transcript_8669:264-992(+)